MVTHRRSDGAPAPVLRRHGPGSPRGRPAGEAAATPHARSRRRFKAAQARSPSSRTFVTPRNMKRRKPIACLLSACQRKTCGTRAGPNSAAGRRGRRRSAYEAPSAAADRGTRLGGAESKRRRRPRLPAPPSWVTLLSGLARSPCGGGASLLASGAMARPRVAAGGGLAAVAYVLRKGREAGGLLRLYRRLRSRNACKSCALGMGGQQGGMVNEAGHFPEVCKKAVQAQAGDMVAPIAERYFRSTPIAAMERLGSAELERLGRLAFPVLAADGDPHFRRVAWAEALDRAGAALRAARPEEVFFYSSGRSSNEAAFLMQLVARAYGTSNIHNCSFYCHNASSVALADVYGSGTASVALDDLAHADLALVAGANPASNHPRLVTHLVELRRRGGKVIVINPLREIGLVRFRVPSDWRSMLFGSVVSDLYLQPHIGSDVALLKALLKGVTEAGGLERPFIDAHTAGWERVEADLAATSWE